MPDNEWRDTAQICSQWQDASQTDPALLEHRASKTWWDLIERLGITLLVTREYEHLVVAFAVVKGKPHVTFLPMPHPSGLLVDRGEKRVYIASTRNPNQIYRLKPIPALVPETSAFFPGKLYLHDLAVIGGRLFGNAVGQNAIARLGLDGGYKYVWWPKAIERSGKPVFTKNHIQLNSIAPGASLASSYFSASSVSLGRIVPGDLDYGVDRKGVIFSGKTREPICTGLTRPHSARLAGGRIWVDNSGYGEFGYVRDGRLEVVAKLPGWTRGLCLIRDIAFVATSRVIPKYSVYAPGLDVAKTRCALYAIDLKSGKTLASLEWPNGNQVFAIDWIASKVSNGFPFEARIRNHKKEIALFYTYNA